MILAPPQLEQNEQLAGNRRLGKRYAVQLPLLWKLIRRRKLLMSGAGDTIDLSSTGIMFDAGRPLPSGLDVELSITWPVLLNDESPMQLAVSGRIVRCNGNTVALRIVQHEFRTVATLNDSRLISVILRPPVVSLAGRVPSMVEALAQGC